MIRKVGHGVEDEAVEGEGHFCHRPCWSCDTFLGSLITEEK